MVMMLVQVDLLVVFDGRNGPPMTCCTKNRAFKLSGCRTAGHCGITVEQVPLNAVDLV